MSRLTIRLEPVMIDIDEGTAPTFHWMVDWSYRSGDVAHAGTIGPLFAMNSSELNLRANNAVAEKLHELGLDQAEPSALHRGAVFGLAITATAVLLWLAPILQAWLVATLSR